MRSERQTCNSLASDSFAGGGQVDCISVGGGWLDGDSGIKGLVASSFQTACPCLLLCVFSLYPRVVFRACLFKVLEGL